MPEQLINGFYHGILMPLIDGFKIFFSSNRFYFSFPILLLLSILISFIGCLQVINKNIMSLWYIEALVWVFRLLQYFLIILFAQHLSVEQFFSKQGWAPVLRGLSEIHTEQLFRDLIGYLIIFGLYNLILSLVINKKWTTKLNKKISNLDPNTTHSAMILGFKNLFLIPVAVIHLLKILKFI